MTKSKSRTQPDAADVSKNSEQEIVAYQLGKDFESLQKAKIMMIDDEAITLQVLRTLLEHAGYEEFHLLSDPLCAMQEIREQKPDVLLLDVVMPGISGFEILTMIRQDSEFSHLPVIILTSSVDAETKLEALDLGATDFLSKPVDASELALRVRNTLAAKAYQDQLSYYHLLTHLPNRNLFLNRLEWMIESEATAQSEISLLHVSISDFSRITDTFGPEVGDSVLKQVAERLSLVISHHEREGALTGEPNRGDWVDLFHLEGASFAAMYSAGDTVREGTSAANRVIEAMSEAVDAEGTAVFLTPSIGLASYPEDARTCQELFRLAAGASSQAAADGGRNLRFYSSARNQSSVTRFNLEASLREALERDEFMLVYQPKIDLASGLITGAEALVRWHTGDGEVIGPDKFIPVAEETGLIIPLGTWVLEEACKQAKDWQSSISTVKMSVNVSARQFFDPGFLSILESALCNTQLSSQQLMVEITESFVLDGVDRAQEVIQSLRELGVGISIDDFGTGYSSLSYLKNLDADELKLDRSFIVDVATSPKDQALVYAVTYLARELGMTVCAEGVEDQQQLAYLLKIQCDIVQGYYYSPPISAPDFVSYFERINGSSILNRKSA